MNPDGGVKRILCLANSRKPNGRCIAGKEVLCSAAAGLWIRPVSDREAGEVSECERQYEDGSDPRVLDVIDVPVRNAAPKRFQQENWLLDPECYWVKVRGMAQSQLNEFVDPIAPLWINGYESFNGLNDRIPLHAANRLDSSLRLICVDRLELVVFQPSRSFGDLNSRLQGRFTYCGVDYWIWVTDPVYERRYLKRGNGNYDIGESYLTVSLGEPHRGFSYKLIAAVIEC